MKAMLVRTVVVILGVITVWGTFTATETLAQCSPQEIGTVSACFITNHECLLDECQGMDCVRSGMCYLGLRCVQDPCGNPPPPSSCKGI